MNMRQLMPDGALARALWLALFIHLAVIFGIRMETAQPPTARALEMDVTLLAPPDPAPEKPVSPSESPARPSRPAIRPITRLAPAAPTPPGNATRLDAAALERQIHSLAEDYAQATKPAPRTLYINSVNVRNPVAAAYERAWQEKIERVGNMNYPAEARSKGLSGTLLLSVSLDPDGSVRDIQIRRGSGLATLDEAALRIVRLAAPFARFPDELRRGADVLVITRTWRFFSDASLSTAP